MEQTDMGDRRIGVIINGATGRMGTTQHMGNLLAIAAEGGLKLENGDRLIPSCCWSAATPGGSASSQPLTATSAGPRTSKRR